MSFAHGSLIVGGDYGCLCLQILREKDIPITSRVLFQKSRQKPRAHSRAESVYLQILREEIEGSVFRLLQDKPPQEP